MPANYGVESPYTQSDSELFTEIDGQLEDATRRSTYQPYFEMFQQSATSEYFNNQNKQGMTGQGNATGFSGSTSQGASGSSSKGSFMESMMGDFGKQIFTIEEDINKKQMQAQGTINDIVQGNRQTALSLKQLAEGNKSGDDGSCVLSTAAYKQGLIDSNELMGFVNWRLKTQKKEFLGNVKWLGYQITWKPISNMMLKNKWFAKFIKKTILNKWMNIIKGTKKHRITKFFVEYISVLGFVINYRKCMALGKKIKKDPSQILNEYQSIIIQVDGDDNVFRYWNYIFHSKKRSI